MQAIEPAASAAIPVQNKRGRGRPRKYAASSERYKQYRLRKKQNTPTIEELLEVRKCQFIKAHPKTPIKRLLEMLQEIEMLEYDAQIERQKRREENKTEVSENDGLHLHDAPHGCGLLSYQESEETLELIDARQQKAKNGFKPSMDGQTNDPSKKANRETETTFTNIIRWPRAWFEVPETTPSTADEQRAREIQRLSEIVAGRFETTKGGLSRERCIEDAKKKLELIFVAQPNSYGLNS